MTNEKSTEDSVEIESASLFKSDLYGTSSSSRYSQQQFIEAQSRRISSLEAQLKTANKTILKTQKKLKITLRSQKEFEKRLSKYLEKDQLEIIKGKTKVQWQPKTIAKALYIRRNGKSVLETVRNYIAPLPSLATLKRHISHIKFYPGIIDSSIQIFAKKCEGLSAIDNIFILAFDETVIIPGMALDTSTNEYRGNVTLPENPEILADQVLAFLVMGVSIRIKEIVAFHFTKKGVTKGEHLLKFLFELIRCVENAAKIRIKGTSFDLSALDCSLIKECGIKFNIQNEQYFIKHPNRDDDILLLIPDGTHNSKNINQGLKNKDVLISKKIQNQHNLSSNKASIKDVEKVFNKDAKNVFKLMPKVTEEVLHTKHFAKMDPQNAVKFHSTDVQSALKLAGNHKNEKQNSTVFILSCFQRYHELITSRTGWHSSDIEKFDDDVNFLEWFANDLLANITIGNGNKKSMFGARMGIFSTISLAKSLFDEGSPQFIPSRLLNDAMENKFAILRSFTPQPSAVQVIQTLRTMALTPFHLKKIKGSYDWDEEDPTQINYLELLSSIIAQKDLSNIQTDDERDIELILSLELSNDAHWQDLLSDENEFNSFVCHMSLLLNKIIPKTACDECQTWLLVDPNHSLERLQGYKLLLMRLGSSSYRHTPSLIILQIFINLEQLYQSIAQILNPVEEDFLSTFIDNVRGSKFYENAHCFSTVDLVAEKYISFRLQTALHARLKHKAQKMGSKSLK